MAARDLKIGNSGAGIMEAASFSVPVLSLNSRQNLRERNANVVDFPLDQNLIITAVAAALAAGHRSQHNMYGDRRSAGRIVNLLGALSMGAQLPAKVNAC